MADNNGPRYGMLKKHRVYAECPKCGYTDFPPGQLNADKTVETRTCEECGWQIETVPLFTAPPGEATHFFEG